MLGTADLPHGEDDSRRHHQGRASQRHRSIPPYGMANLFPGGRSKPDHADKVRQHPHPKRRDHHVNDDCRFPPELARHTRVSPKRLRPHTGGEHQGNGHPGFRPPPADGASYR